MAAALWPSVAAGFKMLDNGCSWYETNRLGGCVRLETPRPECLRSAERAAQRRGGEEAVDRPHALAIIMPYRGTGGVSDLQGLCANLPAHLESQHIRHRLYLVRQVDDLPFNRGALVNAAVRLLTHGQPGEAQAAAHRFEFDYLAVHDIDRFPVGASGSQSIRAAACSNASSEYYRFPHPRPRVLHPLSFAGGVLVVQLSQYEAVNGFSNEYWGWGEEDNDLFLRLRWCGWAPQHGRELESCMEHRDCVMCKRQKQTLDPERLREHERRAKGQLERPDQHLRPNFDGIFTVNYSLVGRSRKRCGEHGVNILSVELHGSAQATEV
mmetsp:Transcript_4373/g.13218  ORF Transcript_4373/g.13218 Transcript_4373/m.13218 type:complete len:324 (+) Transcript_4373:49-1020(+)